MLMMLSVGIGALFLFFTYVKFLRNKFKYSKFNELDQAIKQVSVDINQENKNNNIIICDVAFLTLIIIYQIEITQLILFAY